MIWVYFLIQTRENHSIVLEVAGCIAGLDALINPASLWRPGVESAASRGGMGDRDHIRSCVLARFYEPAKPAS
jgi:hypothetical protein